jgi:hypothetical protein
LKIQFGITKFVQSVFAISCNIIETSVMHFPYHDNTWSVYTKI